MYNKNAFFVCPEGADAAILQFAVSLKEEGFKIYGDAGYVVWAKKMGQQALPIPENITECLPDICVIDAAHAASNTLFLNSLNRKDIFLVDAAMIRDERVATLILVVLSLDPEAAITVPGELVSSTNLHVWEFAGEFRRALGANFSKVLKHASTMAQLEAQLTASEQDVHITLNDLHRGDLVLHAAAIAEQGGSVFLSEWIKKIDSIRE